MSVGTQRRQVVSGPAQQVSKQALSSVLKGSKKLPSRLVVPGVAGVGKTTFAAQSPSPLFLLSPGETGLWTLIDGGLLSDTPNIEVTEWPGLLSLIDELTSSEHNYKTLVLDSIDGFERLCNKFVCDDEFEGNWGEKAFMGFQRGYKIVANGPWRELLAALDKLRATKSMGIILLAHTIITTYQNPEGPDFGRYTPDMYKDAWNVTFSWADMVLFCNRETATTKEKTDRKAKGKGGDARIMLTEWSAIADAKNRNNLPPEISMGTSGKEAWNNFIEAIKQGRATATETKGAE